MHMIALLMALPTALLIAAPVGAQSLCYYWVDADGTVTSYQLPPIDVATPNPLAAEDGGRLIIAPAPRCQDNMVLNAPPPAAPTPAATRSPPTLGEPPSTTPPPAPTPSPDFEPTPESVPDFQLEPLEPMPEPLAEPTPVPETDPVPVPENQFEPAPELEVVPEPTPDGELQQVPPSELRLESSDLRTSAIN